MRAGERARRKAHRNAFHPGKPHFLELRNPPPPRKGTSFQNAGLKFSSSYIVLLNHNAQGQFRLAGLADSWTDKAGAQ